MHVWDMLPETISGVLFVGLGMRVELIGDRVAVSTFTGTDSQGSPVFTAISEPSIPVSNYHCNQLAIVVSNAGATVQLGTNPGTVVSVPELTMAIVTSYTALNTEADADLFRIGPVNAKVWDVRLYGNPKPPTVGGWWPGREVRAPCLVPWRCSRVRNSWLICVSAHGRRKIEEEEEGGQGLRIRRIDVFFSLSLSSVHY